MGAVLCSDKIKIGIGKHGTTLGGNPLACATSIATLNFYLENNLAKQAKEKGDYLMEKLKEKNLSKVREVRGLGLMIGIEIKEKVKPYILELMDLGILALPAGATIIRLLPPLIISYEEIDFVIDSLSQVLK
jgi:acetylornithine/LysW-gamma-L-lysine aminotransferase